MRDFLDKSLPIIFWTIIIIAGTWISWIIVTGRENVEVQPVEPSNEPIEEVPDGAAEYETERNGVEPPACFA